MIVAITAEGPELSNFHYDQVLSPLRDAGAAFYAVAIGSPSTSLADEMRNRAMVLDVGPRESGGSFDQLLTSMALGGKLLLVDSSDDGPVLGLHLGMSGRILIDGEAAGDPLLYASNRDASEWRRFGLRFTDGGSLYLRDPRRD